MAAGTDARPQFRPLQQSSDPDLIAMTHTLNRPLSNSNPPLELALGQSVLAMTWFDDNLAAGDHAILFKVSQTIRGGSRVVWEARTLRRIHQGAPPICTDDLTVRRQVAEGLEIGCEVKAAGGARPMLESCMNIGHSEAHGTISFREHSCSFAGVVDTSNSRRARTPVAQLRWLSTLAADRRRSAELPLEDAAVASLHSCRNKSFVQTELMQRP
ncbi:hypothetical protein IVB18_40970 [Bradyrhizobium sp. 186]|uniref:hypothetical protein n=1 Tax=Bradyrhizobium sp. 186 TaxID=2782654 RepID=UPI00200083D2|nr:hypothetical protein [Bradyrhizobium sp. 186]UPK34422.1 hypothetical protein IVB18_40970 [Bradyrhizobium sp. 186]